MSVYKISKKSYQLYKNKMWYYRPDNYENLYDGQRFKNFNVKSTKNSLTLIPINVFIKEFSKRDFHNKFFDLTEEENYKDNRTSNKKIGLLWLFAGNNKRQFVDSLFEFNNFLPVPNPKNEYIFKLLSAPFNPCTFSTFTTEYNYFNIHEFPGLNGKRNINQIEISIFSEIIENQIKEFKEEFNLSKVILGGFSQAGSMALHVGLNSDVNGVICYNSFMFDFTPLDVEIISNKNILLVNGISDDIVVLREARNSFKRLMEHQKIIKITNIEEAGLMHSLSQTSLSNTKVFMEGF